MPAAFLLFISKSETFARNASANLKKWKEKWALIKTRPEGLLDPKIRDEMSDFLEIFPTENQI